jgi:saccharopepsin
MKFLAVLAVLLPLAVADVHRLKLHKIPPVANNPALETAYLAEKYGSQLQAPMMGAGGSGRRIRLEGDEDLFWTQVEITKGGSSVPLTSRCFDLSAFLLHE